MTGEKACITKSSVSRRKQRSELGTAGMNSASWKAKLVRPVRLIAALAVAVVASTSLARPHDIDLRNTALEEQDFKDCRLHIRRQADGALFLNAFSSLVFVPGNAVSKQLDRTSARVRVVGHLGTTSVRALTLPISDQAEFRGTAETFVPATGSRTLSNQYFVHVLQRPSEVKRVLEHRWKVAFIASDPDEGPDATANRSKVFAAHLPRQASQTTTAAVSDIQVGPSGSNQSYIRITCLLSKE
jgi:hypothetical protein